MSTWLGIDIGTTAVKVAQSAPRTARCSCSGSRASRSRRPAASPRRSPRPSARRHGRRGGLGERSRSRSRASAAPSRRVGLPARRRSRSPRCSRSSSRPSCRSNIAEAVLRLPRAAALRATKSRARRARRRGAKTSDVARAHRARRRTRSASSPSASGSARSRSRTSLLDRSRARRAAVDRHRRSRHGVERVLILESGEPVFARTSSRGTKGLPGTAREARARAPPDRFAHRAQGGEPPRGAYSAAAARTSPGAEAFSRARARRSRSSRCPTPAPRGATARARSPTIPRFAKAIGLALSLAPRVAALNLRAAPLAFERGYGFLREKIPLLAGLGAVILVSFLFSAWAAALRSSRRSTTMLETALSRHARTSSARRRRARSAPRSCSTSDVAHRRGSAPARRRVRRHGEALQAVPAVDDARHRGARRPERARQSSTASSPPSPTPRQIATNAQEQRCFRT